MRRRPYKRIARTNAIIDLRETNDAIQRIARRHRTDGPVSLPSLKASRIELRREIHRLFQHPSPRTIIVWG